MDPNCGPGADACSMNLARIHLMSGDLASAYRSAVASAHAGDRSAIELLIEVCEKAGDPARAGVWRDTLAAL